jgi:uncharacterized protein YjdB
MQYGLNIQRNPDLPAGYIVTVYNGTAPATGGGKINLGIFEHDDGDDSLPGSPDTLINHVMVHHVQEILYKTDFRTFAHEGGFKWPDNITSLQHVKIIRNTDVAVVSITITNDDGPLDIAATAQINVTFNPVNATNKNLTYTSSHPARATVSPTGLVTGVASGAAVITATSVDGAKTDTVTFTVP